MGDACVMVLRTDVFKLMVIQQTTDVIANTMLVVLDAINVALGMCRRNGDLDMAMTTLFVNVSFLY